MIKTLITLTATKVAIDLAIEDIDRDLKKIKEIMNINGRRELCQ